MSLDDLHGLDTTTKQLRLALSKARSLKSGDGVEPPLSAGDYEEDFLVNGGAAQGKDASATGSQSMVIEAAARSVLYERIAVSAIHDAEFVEVWNLLDIVQFCADQGLCEAGLTLWLIEELLDGQTIDGCRGIFDYLESRCERLVGTELTQNKRNTILRTCNELLHRLSRAEDAVFCGRVFIFLFKIFPLGDKSAVNLRGEYHVENTTNYDTSEFQGEAEKMVIDANPTSNTSPSDSTNAVTKPGSSSAPRSPPPTIDFESLYPIFWSLQHVFSNPPRVLQDGQFARFQKSLETTLQKFKSVPKVPTVSAGQASGRKRKRGGGETDLASSFNPKYLTSKDLFKLEVSDVTFQRHILVQALILIEFVLSLTASAKKTHEIIKPQRAMTYGYTLSEEDAAWAARMRDQIGDYLQGNGEGHLYHKMVKTILARDKNWVRWKMESCQPISRPPITPDEFNKTRNDTKRAFGSRKVKAQVMGSIDLGFLAEDRNKNNMAKLRDHAMTRAPDLNQTVREHLDSQQEGQDKASSHESQRASGAWRVLRLAAKSKLALFSEVQDATGGLGALLQQESLNGEKAEESVVKNEEQEQQRPEEESVEGAVGDAADAKPLQVEGVEAVTAKAETTT